MMAEAQESLMGVLPIPRPCGGRWLLSFKVSVTILQGNFYDPSRSKFSENFHENPDSKLVGKL